MVNRRLLLTVGLAAILITTMACSVSLPFGTSTTSPADIATMVAATVMAGTPDAHSVPVGGVTPTTATLSPIRVSFVNTVGNLFVWSDGTLAPVQLTTSGDVLESHISPDGSLIAFTRSSDYMSFQLDVINFDGTNQRTLLSTAQIAALPKPSESLGLIPEKLVWIPGGHRLALNFRVSYEGPGLQIADPLYVLDAETGALSTLVTVGSAWNFEFSPDAQKLLITRPEGIDLYNADGTLVLANAVTHSFVNTASEYAWVARPTWAADSSAFAMGIPPVDPWGDPPSPSMAYKLSNTGAVLSSYSTEMSFKSTRITSFNPTLTKMSFTTRVGVPTDNNWALHIANLDGTGDSVLATGRFDTLPVWSPDGNHNIYEVNTGTSNQTYLGSVDAGPVLLGDVPSMIDVRWIDNSRYVISNRTGTSASLLLGTVGSGFGVIYNDPGPLTDRSFSFDVNR
jgi:Tol biopolymer transport system component